MSRKKRRWPLTLKLKTGLRWKGKLVVKGPHESGWRVRFDAQVSEPRTGQRELFIYDRTVLSTKQVVEWTGVDLMVEE